MNVPNGNVVLVTSRLVSAISWFSASVPVIQGVSVPGSSRSGSIFSIRAGAFFFF